MRVFSAFSLGSLFASDVRVRGLSLKVPATTLTLAMSSAMSLALGGEVLSNAGSGRG